MMSEQTTSQTQQPSAASAPAPTGKPAGKGIILSDGAVKRLRVLLEQRQTPEAGLRLAVKGGGCSGLQYAMEWAEKPRERDKVFERDGVRVFVDPKSYLYLMGTELVFEETLMGSGFKLQNPNVKGACGCGESFTI
ncbi:Iron binding protein IscA for iron-sulfur cluster assembly [Hyalangium minutum]|uniref:Iron binding protein IscA for iron-sulfur cluster assembly n=2 Tax=Hyalangium minutum TaxID=394096 RepID=A0A085WHS3_9BACT|nr:Iron binding protein IscA for iron-sulfur cluster assembly [Hyalangium minutum]